jgi:hypothetical protein
MQRLTSQRNGRPPALQGTPERQRPRHRLRVTALAALALALTLGTGPTGTLRAAATNGCTGVESDFNGDGATDTVIADPEATVGGHERAGKIHVVYGASAGTLELTQDSPGIPGGSEAGDQYGHALAVYDANADGCADLAIGTPFEDIGTQVDAGGVQVVHGSTAGLGAGPTPAKEHFQGPTASLGGGAEAGDWTGHALTAGRTAAGAPFLIVGVPGEATGLSPSEDGGGFYYIHGTSHTVVGLLNQDTEAGGVVPGAVEPDDRFGASLAATPHHFAVGAPGEGVGTARFAGYAAVFSHTLVAAHPKPLLALSQDQATVVGSEEPSDGFATSLAMVPYRHNGATTTNESLLAVGVPGEDLSTTVDAGVVQVFRVHAAGTASEVRWIDQNAADVEGESEAGDFFGQRLAAVNTTPNSVSGATTSRLAVGVPGEEATEEHPDGGGIAVVPLIGAPGVSDLWLAPGDGIPTPPAPKQLTGLSLAATQTSLHIGMPYGPTGTHAAHRYAWGTLPGGTPTTHTPGSGGIPAGDTTFGAAVN